MQCEWVNVLLWRFYACGFCYWCIKECFTRGCQLCWLDHCGITFFAFSAFLLFYRQSACDLLFFALLCLCMCVCMTTWCYLLSLLVVWLARLLLLSFSRRDITWWYAGMTWHEIRMHEVWRSGTVLCNLLRCSAIQFYLCCICFASFYFTLLYVTSLLFVLLCYVLLCYVVCVYVRCVWIVLCCVVSSTMHYLSQPCRLCYSEWVWAS